ncbi:hypothetical protein L2E82_08095 [Cichorium intybus]|uniref:Uncharacterized protein n=1 Tax=Cichorium intybus TaxID=13427 RepID=A0ACB9G5L0_CICIN|nr:hypothetical protein L2E82_08095 [Cichorium intybus]
MLMERRYSVGRRRIEDLRSKTFATPLIFGASFHAGSLDMGFISFFCSTFLSLIPPPPPINLHRCCWNPSPLHLTKATRKVATESVHLNVSDFLCSCNRDSFPTIASSDCLPYLPPTPPTSQVDNGKTMKSSSSSSRISLEQFVSKMNPLIDMEKFNKRTYSKILKPGFVETTLTDGLFFLLVQVKDSGSGIKQQDIPHIFTKFSEPRSATNRISGGAGLGLAICKRFANIMGGHIWIESGGLGKGTTVAFLVKLGHCNFQNEMPVKARVHQGSGELIKHRLVEREGYSFPFDHKTF